jgi:hypothetical protein
VYCANPEYAFEVEQAQENGPYYVKEHCWGAAGIRSFADFRTRFVLQSPWGNQMNGESLIETMRRASTKIHACRTLSEDGVGLFEATFSYEPESLPGGADRSRREAVVVFEPEARWRIVRECTKSDSMQYELTVSYRDRTDPGAFATMVHVIRPSTGGVSRETEVFQPLSYEPIPASEFRMTAFGLPEPPRPGGRVVGWTAAAGAGFFSAAGLLGALCWWRNRGRRCAA